MIFFLTSRFQSNSEACTLHGNMHKRKQKNRRKMGRGLGEERSEAYNHIL